MVTELDLKTAIRDVQEMKNRLLDEKIEYLEKGIKESYVYAETNAYLRGQLDMIKELIENGLLEEEKWYLLEYALSWLYQLF